MTKDLNPRKLAFVSIPIFASLSDLHDVHLLNFLYSVCIATSSRIGKAVRLYRRGEIHLDNCVHRSLRICGPGCYRLVAGARIACAVSTCQ